MNVYVDHYVVLGLASEEEGANFTEKEITKVFKLKALELHPDKRPDDPNAHENFLKLSASYDVLRDEKKRKLFDALLGTRRRKREEETNRRSFTDSKRRKMKSDLEERERFAAAVRKFKEEAKKAQRDEDEITARKFKEEVDAIRANFGYVYPMHNVTSPSYGSDNVIDPSWKRKVLKVSWASVGEGYDVQKLRNYFGSFGVVEEVIVLDKNKNSAYVVMASRDAVVAATKMMWVGDFSNPLSVKPLRPVRGFRTVDQDSF